MNPVPTPPLALPTGSVRALLVLLLTLTLWYLVLVERAVPEYLADTAYLAIAFYFGARSSEGSEERLERPPLFLPKGFLRGLIFVGFVAVAAYFWYTGRVLPEVFRSILTILSGYAAGALTTAAVRAMTSRTRPGALSAFGHVKAVACLAGVAFLCVAAVTGQHALVPQEYLTAMELIVSFYFGSRSVA